MRETREYSMRAILLAWKEDKVYKAPDEDFARLKDLAGRSILKERREALGLVMGVLTYATSNAIRWEAMCFAEVLLSKDCDQTTNDMVRLALLAAADSFHWVLTGFQRILKSGAISTSFDRNEFRNRLQIVLLGFQSDFRRLGGSEEESKIRAKFAENLKELNKKLDLLRRKTVIKLRGISKELSAVSPDSIRAEQLRSEKGVLVLAIKDDFPRHFDKERRAVSDLRSSLARFERLRRSVERIPQILSEV